MNVQMESGQSNDSANAAPTVLVACAKVLTDLDDLVRLLQVGLVYTKPWQRKLVDQLREIDSLLQVLRMTVLMERPGAEVLGAAEALWNACCRANLAVAGSRADQTTKSAVRLIAGLASCVRGHFDSAKAGPS